MRHIGVISDTHGLLRPSAVIALSPATSSFMQAMSAKARSCMSSAPSRPWSPCAATSTRADWPRSSPIARSSSSRNVGSSSFMISPSWRPRSARSRLSGGDLRAFASALDRDKAWGALFQPRECRPTTLQTACNGRAARARRRRDRVGNRRHRRGTGHADPVGPPAVSSMARATRGMQQALRRPNGAPNWVPRTKRRDTIISRLRAEIFREQPRLLYAKAFVRSTQSARRRRMSLAASASSHFRNIEILGSLEVASGRRSSTSCAPKTPRAHVAGAEVAEPGVCRKT